MADDTLIILLFSEQEEIVQVACAGNRNMVKSWLQRYEIKFDVDKAIKIDETVFPKEMLHKFDEGEFGTYDERDMEEIEEMGAEDYFNNKAYSLHVGQTVLFSMNHQI